MRAFIVNPLSLKEIPVLLHPLFKRKNRVAKGYVNQYFNVLSFECFRKTRTSKEIQMSSACQKKTKKQ